MKKYLALCLKGQETIPERRKLLEIQREFLVNKMKELQECIDFIDYDVLNNERIDVFISF